MATPDINLINKRRIFGIISHPDAGKTTLTEKLLLHGDGNDGLAHLLELRKVIDHLAAEERTAVLQSRLVDNHRSSFRLDPLHHAQDAALAEVIGFALHGQAEYTYYTCFFFIFTVVTFIIIVIISCHRKYLISNKIFSRPIRFYNC